MSAHGTPFQRLVWSYLKTIPKGEVRSYAEVARAIGSPKAVRAVANACGANTEAITVPCHRVVCSNGKLGGYRWGVARKEALLKKEGVKFPLTPRLSTRPSNRSSRAPRQRP